MGAEAIQVEGDAQKQLDLEVRDMVSALTRRVTDLHRITNNMQTKSGSSQTHADGKEVDEDNAGGPRVITLAGSNTGATMQGRKGEMNDQPYRFSWGEEDEEEEMTTYVNSNFQAINNSLVFGGSYSSNDPGVHIEIIDDSEVLQEDHHEKHHKHKKEKKSEKKDKKGKKDKKSDEEEED